MSKNVAIGVLVVLILAGGGYALYRNNVAKGGSDTATTTASGGDNTAGAGNSDGSTPSPTPTPAPTTDAPIVRTDSSVVPSSSTAIVTGSVNPNGAATTYWYEYGETTALGTRTSAQTIGSGTVFITAPALLTGLKQNTLYHFRLSAKNAFGTVNGATLDFRTTTSPPPSGTAPNTRTVAASDISRTTANLHGQVNPNGSPTTYWFEYGETTDFGRTTSLQSLGAGSDLTNVAISLSNLNPLTRYYFRLNAQNQYGTVNGSILNFTTTGPVAPGAPTVDTISANNITASSATLRGRINPNGGTTTYWFEYSQDSLLGSILGTVTPDETLSAGNANIDVSADVRNLVRNTRYFYRAVGRNSFGTVRGDIVEFRTRP